MKFNTSDLLDRALQLPLGGALTLHVSSKEEVERLRVRLNMAKLREAKRVKRHWLGYMLTALEEGRTPPPELRSDWNDVGIKASLAGLTIRLVREDPMAGVIVVFDEKGVDITSELAQSAASEEPNDAEA